MSNLPRIHINDLTPADQNDWCQGLEENPLDPLEEIRQLHESFLNDLEGLAVEAIASNNWDAFYAHVVNFKMETTTKDLQRQGGGFLSNPNKTEGLTDYASPD